MNFTFIKESICRQHGKCRKYSRRQVFLTFCKHFQELSVNNERTLNGFPVIPENSENTCRPRYYYFAQKALSDDFFSGRGWRRA